MTAIAQIERELQTVNSLLASANFTSMARPHLEQLKLTLEQQLRSLREEAMAAAAKAT